MTITCPKCQSVYCGAAIDRLPEAHRRHRPYSRVSGVVGSHRYCLCQIDGMDHPVDSADELFVPAEGSKLVIVRVSSSWWASRYTVGSAVRRTNARVVVRVGETEHQFDMKTGRGGDRSLDPEELEIAIRLTALGTVGAAAKHAAAKRTKGAGATR